MSDNDQLVRRAIDAVTAMAARAGRFATWILLATVVICVGGFLLGIAALGGGIETVWIVLGIVFGALAIGWAFVARWRVGSVRRHVPELADEVRRLVRDGDDAGRTVVETFVVDDDLDRAPGDPDAGSAIVMSRQMYGFRGTMGSGLEGSPRLTAAVAALTTFPLLLLGAVLISTVFAFLGLIFLIALAL